MIYLLLSLAMASPQDFIIGGGLMAADDLPQIQMLSLDGEPHCTATLVGPKVILTAAHCCHGNSNFKFERSGKAGFKKLVIESENNPDYPVELSCESNNMPKDMALRHDQCLGLLESEVKDIKPISLSTSLPVLGEKLSLVGVGYPRPGTRQMGKMFVESLSEIGASLRNEKGQITGDGGDSGGATLRIDKNKKVTYLATTSTSSRDTVICNAGPFTTGIVLSGSDSAQDFFKAFAKKHQVDICGISKDCE